MVVNGNDRTPLSSTVEENLDNPEFIEAVASLDSEVAKIVNQEGDNLRMMATPLFCQSTIRRILRLNATEPGQTPHDLVIEDNTEDFDFFRLLLC